MAGSEDGGSWRRYVDLLTPEQIAHCERCVSLLSPECRDAQLLDIACLYAERNRKNAEYADVPLPPGSEQSFEWLPYFEDDLHGDNGWRRLLQWAEYPAGIEDVQVILNGWQKPDGTYIRQVGLYLEDEAEMTAEQARALAAALLKAADDLDRG